MPTDREPPRAPTTMTTASCSIENAGYVGTQVSHALGHDIPVTQAMIAAAIEWTPSPWEISAEDAEAYADMIRAILMAMDETKPPPAPPP